MARQASCVCRRWRLPRPRGQMALNRYLADTPIVSARRLAMPWHFCDAASRSGTRGRVPRYRTITSDHGMPGVRARRVFFRRAAMKISDVMTRDAKLTDLDDTLRHAAELMKQCDCGVLPVGEGDHLVGMITDRDIVVRCIAEGK